MLAAYHMQHMLTQINKKQLWPTLMSYFNNPVLQRLRNLLNIKLWVDQILPFQCEVLGNVKYHKQKYLKLFQ